MLVYGFVFVCLGLVGIFLHLGHAMLVEVRRGHWIPWDWRYSFDVGAGYGTSVLWKSSQVSLRVEQSLQAFIQILHSVSSSKVTPGFVQQAIKSNQDERKINLL